MLFYHVGMQSVALYTLLLWMFIIEVGGHCCDANKTNGTSKRHSCFSGTDEVIVGEEMEISLNKLYIWNQQTTGNPMLVFLSRVSLVFINWQIFILHFHYDNFSLTENFSLQNVRSPRGNRFPKRKLKLDKMLRSYAWFLQSVSMI